MVNLQLVTVTLQSIMVLETRSSGYFAYCAQTVNKQTKTMATLFPRSDVTLKPSGIRAPLDAGVALRMTN